MAIDRRQLLQLGAAGIASLAIPLPAHAGGKGLYVSSAAEAGGGYTATVIDETGKKLFSLPIETRGHDAAADPVRPRAVLFARRPGRFALIVDADRQAAAPILFAPPGNRVFNGHGAFSADGKLLYATENNADTADGYLGIYETDGFRRVGEFATHGIGPHEAILSPDGNRLLVANGGIATDPEIGAGRQNLNTATMRPSLTELDRRGGELLNRVELSPELHQLSIRHLAFDRSGTAWFGCQWEGEPTDHPPLLGTVGSGGKVDLIALDRQPLLAARNYIGAIAANRDGTLIAASCPRGGMILVFDAGSGKVVGTTRADDSSGIAPLGASEFLATSGDGSVLRIGGAGKRSLAARNSERYDNHLRSFAAG